jgi:glycosyltransferase involved in cell wall biosynthesis
MRIIQIIHGVHNPSAGPTYSVAKLADELHALGEETSVLTLGRAPAEWPYKSPLKIHDGALESKTGVSLSLMREIRRLSHESCILHGHGIWRLANLFPLFLSRDTPARIICSPRGTLSPWSMRYKALVKQPFWQLLQKPALQRCPSFHATSPDEYENIRRVGLRSPVALIPNGIDLPDLATDTPRLKRVVFLSRIDPVKGLDLLLPAWTAIARNFSDWELVIAGPLTSAYADSIQALARDIQAPRVKFMGEVVGRPKRALLSSASLFVLPSYSENFGVAVAEALAHGVPVITTTATPWAEVVSRDCGWYIAPNVEALRETLQEALGRPLPALHEMGRKGRSWMQQNYAWARIAEMMQQTYQWLLYGTARPDWVIKN